MCTTISLRDIAFLHLPLSSQNTWWQEPKSFESLISWIFYSELTLESFGFWIRWWERMIQVQSDSSLRRVLMLVYPGRGRCLGGRTNNYNTAKGGRTDWTGQRQAKLSLRLCMNSPHPHHPHEWQLQGASPDLPPAHVAINQFIWTHTWSH